MTLNQIFGRYKENLPQIEVKGLSQNSKEIQKDWVFFAVKGHTVDGHEYIPSALLKGACAVVTQEELEEVYPVPVIKVPNIDEAMADAACAFYGNPSN